MKLVPIPRIYTMGIVMSAWCMPTITLNAEYYKEPRQYYPKLTPAEREAIQQQRAFKKQAEEHKAFLAEQQQRTIEAARATLADRNPIANNPDHQYLDPHTTSGHTTPRNPEQPIDPLAH